MKISVYKGFKNYFPFFISSFDKRCEILFCLNIYFSNSQYNNTGNSTKTYEAFSL